MRKFISILILSIVLCNSGHATRRTLTNQGTWGAYYVANVNFTVNAGDTLVVLNSSALVTMALQGFIGTVTDTIVIINGDIGGSNCCVFALHGCRYIKFTGSGDPATFYGLTINGGASNCGTSSGIDVDGQSSHIVIERVFFTNVWYSARVKQDGSCYDSLNYPNWHLDNITLQDTWSKNISADCMYFGNTAPVDPRQTPCGTFPIPMRLSNITIRRNLIEHVGRTGIQLSGCDSGFQDISFNTVRGCGYETSNQQGVGIFIGGETSNCNLHDNTTDSTFQFGIRNTGILLNQINNNSVHSPGMLQAVERDKDTLTNTDTSYHAFRCYFFENSDIPAISVKLHGVKISGTTSGYAYVVGKRFTGNGYPMCSENQFPDGLTTISDTIQFQNITTQDLTFTINVPSQFYKIIVKQIGTQVNVWTGYMFNNWYPYSISIGTKPTGPVIDSASCWIRNNKCDNLDSIRGGKNVAADDDVPNGRWNKVGNIICQNYKQDGTPAYLGISSTFIYTTNCSGSTQYPVVVTTPRDTVVSPATSLNITGSASSPNGAITSHVWTQTSGAACTITSPTSYNTSITGLTIGVYTFVLTATDNTSAVGSATKTVTVTAAINIPPIADAGSPQSITLPVTTFTLVGSGTDPDGTITAYAWTRVSGTSTGVSIASPASATTNVTITTADIYIFRLTVTDNSGGTGFSDVMITVNGLPGIKVRSITIDHTKVGNTTDLYQLNFPILIQDTLSYLKKQSNGGQVESEFGYDINFSSDSLGLHKLSWEIENYNNLTGAITAWVKVDTLKSTIDKVIYMTYHDTVTSYQSVASDTWNNNFIAVYHKGDIDATFSAYNGGSTATLNTTGKIGTAYNYQGFPVSSVNLGQTPIPSDTVTMSAWLKPTNFGGFFNVIAKGATHPQPIVWHMIGDGFGSGGKMQLQKGNGQTEDGVNATTAMTVATWNYVAVTVKNLDVIHYLAGNPNGTGTMNANGTGSDGLLSFYIGAQSDNSGAFIGGIDEIRVSRVRTADWIKTEYNNQNSPTTFYTIGAEHTIVLNQVGTFRHINKFRVVN